MNLPVCGTGVKAPCRYVDASTCKPAVDANGWASATYIRYRDEGGHDIPVELCCQDVTRPDQAATCPGVLVDGQMIYTCDKSKGFFDDVIRPSCFGCQPSTPA
jgi:hypothetical protein